MTTRKQGRGVLTIAIGERYITMAINLIRSVRRFNRDLSIGVVTDNVEYKALKANATHLVSCDPNHGTGVSQKLWIDQYSPFEETLFIDADCLVFGSLEYVWDLLARKSFGVIGTEIRREDQWWYFSGSGVFHRLGLQTVPKFNGGLYYFKNDEAASVIFDRARAHARNYRDLGLAAFRESLSDEPVYALALAEAGVQAISDPRIDVLVTPDEMGYKTVTMDTVNGEFDFRADGILHHGKIAHFFGNWVRSYHYHRETVKLKLLDRGVPSCLVTLISRVCLDSSYWILFVGYTSAKRLILRRKVPQAEGMLPFMSLDNFQLLSGIRDRISHMRNPKSFHPTPSDK